MTTSLRDVASAEMVRTLAGMNCFELDCVVYGYGWKKPDGQKMYSMSDDELLIQKAFEEHTLERCCMTPIQQWSTRSIVKEETKEESKENTDDSFSSFFNLISGIDVDKISDGLNGMKKILNILSEVTATEDVTSFSKRRSQKPYKRDDD